MNTKSKISKQLLAFVSIIFISITSNAQQKSQHTTTAANISNNSTFLDVNGLNNNREAIIIVEYGAATRTANPHPVGVWFNGKQWAVFNQDKAAMPEGLSFSIIWKNADANSFFQKLNANNSSGGKMVLDNPSLNNKPVAAFYVSQVWNPDGVSGVYNNSDIGLAYDPSLAKWLINNTNGSPIPDGAAFNISIVSSIGNNTAVVSPTNNNSNPAVAIIDRSVVQAVTSASANLGFEELFLNWQTTGSAFSNQPVSGNTVASERVLTKLAYAAGGIGGDYWKGISYPIGYKGKNWIGTFENGNGDVPIGTLTSKPIIAEKRYFTFLLGGGKDINKLYVELQVKKSDYEAAWGAGKKGLWGDTEDGFTKVSRITSALNSEELYRYYFDLNAELNNQLNGKVIRIKIVDEKSTSWGHINVDDFLFKDDLSDFLSFQRDGFALLADKDKPIWGFADTHAHWVNHIGLNGLMHGTPGGKLETSNVSTDIKPCDGFNHGLPSFTPAMLIAQTEKAAFNRIPERLINLENAACIAAVVATGIAFLPTSGIATIAGAGLGATFGALGQAASGAQAATGAIDGLITGTVLGLVSNPAFQACGYDFTKDVFAKHYSNTTPDNRTEISNYVDFPRWNSFFHQMMHISWVRRSYDGGQRLMVVPVGTAKSWEFNTTSNGVMGNAKQHIENAVSELKRLVGENPDWMEIAYSAKQAREIILSNKMAIVIALEHAEVGNYFQSVEEEINWVANLGIRHVFMIHNIDNKLGGAGVFFSAMNSYNDLVNRSSVNGSIQALHVREGNTSDETRTTVKLNRSFMRQGMRNIPIRKFGDIPFFYMNDVPAEEQYDNFTYHKNSQGLTAKGRDYLTSLMKKGMVVDVDHMSDLSQDYAMRYMSRFNYPMISGHTNFRDLRRENSETGGGDKETRLKNESTIFSSRAREISNAGGMFGLMTQQNNVKSAAGCPVENKSPGGSSSFAQAYWYALQKTGEEKGIAFGSDFNGFAPQVAPRFGVDAGIMLEGDDVINVSTGSRAEDKLRRTLAFTQKNGVQYDDKIKTYHYHRFLQPAFLTWEERETWEALAIAKSGVDINTAWQPGGGLSAERTYVQQNKVKNLATGFRLSPAQYAQLDCPEYGITKGDCPPERRAAYMCVNGEASVQPNWKDARTMELYRVIKPIYDLWMQFEKGPNEPMRRSYAYTGGRDFDFNLDGLAHYGMFPDLIQDLKNQGLKAQQLKPLFLATEQYIKMWDQADAAKATVRE